MPREPWQFIPAAVLEAQKRAEEAQTWASARRAELARSWADLHLRDALDTFGTPITPTPTTQEPILRAPGAGTSLDSTLTPFDEQRPFQGAAVQAPDGLFGKLTASQGPAGMMREGLRPNTDMSRKRIVPPLPPRLARIISRLPSGTATSAGSPAFRPSSRNEEITSRYWRGGS